MVLKLGAVLCVGLLAVQAIAIPHRQGHSNLLDVIVRGEQEDSVNGVTYNIIFNNPDPTITCSGRGPSFEPHPNDATKFLLCREGQVYYMFQCVPGYVFKPSIRACIYLPGAYVTERTPPTDQKTPQPEEKTPVPYQQTPRYEERTPEPVQETPKPPVFAVTNRPFYGYSLPPQGAQTERPIIVYRQATPNPCQTDSTVFYYPHPTDRTKYFQCDQFGDAFLKTCPDNKLWHQEFLQCILDGLYMAGKPVG